MNNLERCDLGGVSVRESPLLPERILKAHSLAYDLLKATAQRIKDEQLTNGRDLWRQAVREAMDTNGNIKASDGDVEAAMKRLRRKDLLSFLD